MRHARQRQLCDLAADIEVDDHTLVTLAIGADKVTVVGREEEIIERRCNGDAAAGEQSPFSGKRFFHPGLVAVNEPVMEWPSPGVGRHFPDFGRVLQRQHEALAARRLVDG